MNKIGLVLGAGGARGVAHLGVLQALEENGIKVDIIMRIFLKIFKQFKNSF